MSSDKQQTLFLTGGELLFLTGNALKSAVLTRNSLREISRNCLFLLVCFSRFDIDIFPTKGLLSNKEFMVDYENVDKS